MLRQPPVERALLVEDAALLGLCSRIANATGADQVPAVRETLGKMAAIEATIGGLVNGQINAFESWPDGYACFNRRFMYAGLEWCTQNYSMFIDELRTLCGGGVFQMPADISVMDDPEMKSSSRRSGRRRRPTASRA